MQNGSVNEVDFVEISESKTTCALDEVRFGRHGIVIPEATDDDAGQMDELGVDLKNAGCSYKLRFYTMRRCTVCH